MRGFNELLGSSLVVVGFAMAAFGCASSGPLDRWASAPPGFDDSSSEVHTPTASMSASPASPRHPDSPAAASACAQRKEGEACSVKTSELAFDGACELQRMDLGIARLACTP